jgi:hypothetical protein
MTLNSLRWTLGALAGLSLAACAETATDQTDQQLTSAEAPQPLAEQAPPPDRHHGDRGGRHRHDPADLVERFDANENGQLEVSELPEHKRDKMTAADANKDGVLSLEELEKHRPMIMRGKGPRDPAAMLAHLDANKNGTLEVSELPEHKRDKMAAADANKDGALSVDELKAHFEARRREHQAPQN